MDKLDMIKRELIKLAKNCDGCNSDVDCPNEKRCREFIGLNDPQLILDIIENMEEKLVATHIEIDFEPGCRISEAVEELLSYKGRGILAKGRFNGVELFSDTVTLDNAYIALTGETKTERDKKHAEWVEDRRKEELEHNSKMPALSIEWIDKGKEVLDERYHDMWSEIVPVRLSDLYRGMELV